MSRLILLSGTGGAGTSTVAAAAAEAAREEGLTAIVLDGTGEAPGDPGAQAAVAVPVGRVFADLGADAVLPEAWSGLVGLSHLSTLLQAESGLDSADVVVVDAGGHARARELVQLPATALRLLDAALTPRLAMRRPADGGEGVFESLSALRQLMVRLDRMLMRPSTTIRLVTQPRMEGVERTTRALAVLSTLGVGVDGIIVNRYPRASEGWPKAVMARADRALAAMTAAADGVPVWKSTARLRPAPKGHSVVGPLGRVRVLDADQLTVVVAEETLMLDLPLTSRARGEARVGVQGESLVVALGDVHRWLPLPPVLRRCRPISAERTEGGVRLVFEPDPATWRQPGPSGVEHAHGPDARQEADS